MYKSEYLNNLLANVKEKYQYEPEFVNAVEEFFDSIDLVLEKKPEISESGILERLIVPERIMEFRIPWVDDQGKIQVNTGYRVQFNSAIGPYKGGLRLDKSVNLSILKFLGFEQIFKNSLTGLPMGGAKGGSDFSPIGKSDAEVMRFCQSFMQELYHFIGPNMDVPAGDIGFGAREAGFMFGEYKKLTHLWDGGFTGKGISYGGSLTRTEATGFGLCYFTDEMLKKYFNSSFKGKKVIISGCGNVAHYAAVKACELGATVIGMSDRHGIFADPNGVDLDLIFKTKEKRENVYEAYVKAHPSCIHSENHHDLWKVKADIVLPCATQNEINLSDAQTIKNNGTIIVAEGANMPTELEAIRFFNANGVIFAPGKASNAGGVAVSGLEMSQNAMHLSWTFEEVDARLKDIMIGIFNKSYEAAKEFDKDTNLALGANVAGFMKVYDAMRAEGIV